MGLWEQATAAAREARADHDQLRARWEEVARRLFGAAPRPAGETAPTLTVDHDGHARPDAQPHALRILGQSLLLAASSLLAAGMAWLAAFFLGLYLFFQRLFGLRVHAPA
ncbi:MAG: hypothetical protein HY904_12815 [Deltaproteobacteria bacterium]|nr:hypothetical protein [Deltaproteobacteria bacterium]